MDVNEKGLERGEKIITRNVEQDVQRGRATQEKVSGQWEPNVASFVCSPAHSPTLQAEANLSRLTTSTSLDSLSPVDMVVEAVFENMDLKKKIFKDLDGIVAKDCIICTNTSTLDIDEIGGVVENR